MDFQKYNIKEKKQKEKGKKKKKATRIIKTKQNKTPITTQRLYMVFALKKKKKGFFFNSNSRL